MPLRDGYVNFCDLERDQVVKNALVDLEVFYNASVMLMEG